MVVEEDCDGVGEEAVWSRVEGPAELVDEGLGWATVGDQIAGFRTIAWGAGTFVAPANSVGEDVLQVAVSGDGMTWDLVDVAAPEGGTTLGRSAIQYQRDQFIFLAGFWGGGAYVFTSPDGRDWTPTRTGDGMLYTDFATDGDRTVFIGGNNAIASSTDLQTFTPITTTAGSFSYSDIAAGNGQFVATANGFVDGQTSADTVSWDGLVDLQMHTVEFGRGLFAAFRYPDVRTSTDGVHFTLQTATGDRSGWPPIFTGNRFLTLGVSNGVELPVAQSTDAVAWSPFGSLPLTPLPKGASNVTDYFTDIACSECTCVFVGVTIVGHLDTDPWSQDNLPLLAMTRVLAAP